MKTLPLKKIVSLGHNIRTEWFMGYLTILFQLHKLYKAKWHMGRWPQIVSM
jgi:hypothetical protein